jgi:rod shape-determining protein MreB and related proteins
MIRNLLTPKRLAIDFGTANCVIIDEAKGIVLQEPTVVAISPKEKKVVAVGEEAKIMLGKVPEGLEAKRPLKNGGISNYRLAEALLKRFFRSVIGKIILIKPEVIVAAPAGLTSVEERALTQALISVGAGRIYILPEPVAAAIGAGLPINQSTGNLIVNLGGGTAEIAVLSLNGVVAYESYRGSGDAINSAIANYLKRKHQLIVGENTAEDLKINYASAMEVVNPQIIEVKGKDARTGQPTIIKINSNELVAPTREMVVNIADAVKRVLTKTPPELMADIIDNGMVLSGGTSMLKGIDEFLIRTVNIPATVVDEPLVCVARGLDIALRNLDSYKRSVKSA